MFSKQNIIYLIMALIIIWAFGYMAYGEEDNGSDDKVQAIQESLARLNLHNNMSLKLCNDEAILKEEDAFKRKAYADKCFNEKKADDIDLKRQLKELTNSWTLMTGSTVIPPKELDELFNKVCKSKPSSPICDRATFDRLYKITEDRLPWKNFFPILLGITNAESSLGTAYAKNNKGWYCTGYNNLGWIKWKKTDDGKSVRDQKIPDSNGCYLYKFDSIDDYWISKVNTIRYGYKWCVNSTTPIKCMSYAYVGDRNVAETSWINNVSIFLP